ncbi:hypothetical protein GCM10025880_32180 [Methylorubrum aminovorans]|nr:hypothetical protein GCM10025880_32180 [Methylorubrum aminovorans]
MQCRGGFLGQAAEHQADEGETCQEFEVGAKHLFETARLAGDIESTEPFDVGAGRPVPMRRKLAAPASMTEERTQKLDT